MMDSKTTKTTYFENNPLENEIVEKPLSPVLSKKRFNRQTFLDKKTGKKKRDKSSTGESIINTKNDNTDPDRFSSPVRRSSGKTTPKKEYSKFDFEPSHSPVRKQRDEASSNTMGYKNKIVNDSYVGNNKKYNTNNEITLAKPACASDNKVKDYSEVFAEFLNSRNGAELRIKQIKHDVPVQNLFSECAATDMSEDEFDLIKELKERTKFINGEERKTNKLDMIYENKDFEMSPASKTTIFGLIEEVDSEVEIQKSDSAITAGSSRVSSTTTFNKIGQSSNERAEINEGNIFVITNNKQDMNKQHCGSFVNNNFKSQLNYNLGTDDSSSSLGQNIKRYIESKNCERDIFSLCTQETNQYFADIAMNLNTTKFEHVKNVCETRTIPEDSQIQHVSPVHCRTPQSPSTSHKIPINKGGRDNINQDSFDDDDDLLGFTESQIRKVEESYDKYKKMLIDLENETAERLSQRGKVKKSKPMNKESYSTPRKECDKREESPNTKKIKYSPNSTPNNYENTSPHKGKTNKEDRSKKNSSTNTIQNLISNKVVHAKNQTYSNISKETKDGNIKVENGNALKPEKLTKINVDRPPKSQDLNCNSSVQEKCSRRKRSPKKVKKVYNEEESLKPIDEGGASEQSPNSFSLPPNNRVQICIGNNRIKINIKSDNRDKVCETTEALNNEGNEAKPKIVSSNIDKVKKHRSESPVPFEINKPLNMEGFNPGAGFKSASGKSIQISNKVFQDAVKFFEEPIEAQEKKVVKPLLKPRPECGRPFIKGTSRKSLQFHENTIKDTYSANGDGAEVLNFKRSSSFNIKFTEQTGFTLASGKNIAISKDKLEKAVNMFNEIEKEVSSLVNVRAETPTNIFTGKGDGNKFIDFNKINNETSTNKIDELTEDVTGESGIEITESKVKIGKSDSFHLSPLSKTSQEKNDSSRKPAIKKRLGISRFKPYSVSKEKLEKAKQIFDKIDAIPETIKPCTKFAVYSCTPVKINPFKMGPINHTSTPNNKNMQLPEPNITPIKQESPKSINQDFDCESTILFKEGSCSNFAQIQSDIDKEFSILKRKLDILQERKNALAHQQSLVEGSDVHHKRPKLGVLTKCKSACKERVPLKNLFNSGDENVDYFNLDQNIFEVTPKNADQIHFNLAGENETASIIKTKDDATIIPNSSNIVGITEIKNGFEAMEGVDPKILPNGWVQNHYKWVVWKLASYERKFPQYFKDCLSIENIIQQLKYRYDKEIDNVQRPALRKIFEKDDVPQKCLILCVSDILQVLNNKFELELTDGWYAIIATIDPPLSQQIYRNKIKIGTKLIIYGAELMNCEDGCHPLQAPEFVRLKICYNSTRRAKWYTKLGYHKCSTPFPINMSTLHPEGGHIGQIRIYIARVYPLRYLEDYNNIKIWRNEKAEEKRSTDFEIERMQQLEKIKYQAIQEFECDSSKGLLYAKNARLKDNIKLITCAKTLYDLVQTSDDPEAIVEMLSLSQQKSILEYKQNMFVNQQKEFSDKVSKQIEDLKMNKRNITPLLKLLIMDLKENDKAFVLNIWRPNNEHLEILKEDTCFFVYNLVIKQLGELQSTNKTFFKPADTPIVHKKAQRQLLPIAMTVDNYYKPLFNEFDTVGLIVQMTINNYDQDLWLTDFIGRLLYVKIPEGPKLCALLDNLKRGQTVALSNIIINNPQKEYGQAIANQFSIISQYPQKKFLQHGLEIFKQQLPEDTTRLLNDCDIKIDGFKSQGDFKNNLYKNNSVIKQIANFYDFADDSTEDNSTIPSRLTLTDVAMSLIDTDQFS